MKNNTRIELTLLFTLVMVGASTAGVLAATRPDTSTLTLTYTYATPTHAKITILDKTYDTVTIPNSAIMGHAGDPSLPATGAYILLPAGMTATAVTATGTSHSLGTGYHIVPIGVALPTSSDPIPPTPNPTVYASNDAMPSSLCSIVGIQHLRGYTILVLTLYPIHYRPASGELIAYTSLDVTVTLAPSQTKNDMLRGLPQDVALVKDRVDNPSQLATYQPKSSMRSSADMMILTTSALKSGFVPLAEAHNATGITTIIRTLDDVGSTDQENIRQYVKTQYQNLGISYLLIGGDDVVVPCRELYVLGMDENTTEYTDNLPADIYFGCLDGTYNYDGDSQWGEPTDGDNGGDVDLMAEVWVGRACVDNTNDVNNFVMKTCSYINSTTEQDPYLMNVTLAAEYLGDYGIASYGSSYMNELINGSDDNGFTTVGIPASIYTLGTLYDTPSYSWQPSELISLINKGIHFLNHLGHANQDYNMKMGESDVMALTNTKLCFIYSQGCDSGWFDNWDCIAETFTVKTVHGAFAGVWNARYGFFWSYSTDGDSQRLHRQLWDAVFDDQKTTVGAANHDCKEDNIFIINRSCIRWCVYETNLFGDPATDLVKGVSPKAPPAPNGPATGISYATYQFQAVTTDPQDEQIYYLFDWGDGTSSGWIGPYASGTACSASHAWSQQGTYAVKAKAKDTADHESGWSPGHGIVILKPPLTIGLASVKGRVEATITNTGTETVDNIDWSIAITGGFLSKIAKNDNGTAGTLAPGASTTVQSSKVFGLGYINIRARALGSITNKQGFILGPFLRLW
jgi:hypothetical protein